MYEPTGPLSVKTTLVSPCVVLKKKFNVHVPVHALYGPLQSSNVFNLFFFFFFWILDYISAFKGKQRNGMELNRLCSWGHIKKTGADVLLPKPTSSAQQPIHRRNRSSQTPSTNIIYTLHICVRVCTVHKMLSGCFASKVFQGISSQKFACF